MARWAPKPNTLRTRSSPDLRRRIWLSEQNEIGGILARARLPDRAGAPVDIAQFACNVRLA
jgi:hypothetical protein